MLSKMKYSSSVTITALLLSLSLVNGIKHTAVAAVTTESLDESLLHVQHRNRGLRHRGLRHRGLKSKKGKSKKGKDGKGYDSSTVGIPGTNRGFDLVKQADVFEMYQCDPFESASAQRALNHPEVDEQCLENRCPNGCCRRYYWLICDETDQLPYTRCICNANTNSGSSSGGNDGNISIQTTIDMTPNANTVVDTTTTTANNLPLITNPPSILDIVSSTAVLSTLLDFVGKADLANVLNGQTLFTLFAPTNSAFAKLPSDIVNFLSANENKDLLAEVLTYHIARGQSSTLTPGNIDTVQGQSLLVGSNPTMTSRTINGANFVGAKLEATNGVIYMIDEVLIQEFVLAKIFNSGSTTTTTTTTTTTNTNVNDGNIIDISVVNPSLSTFTSLAMSANLEQTLNSFGSLSNTFTMFAPTNDAFAKLPTNIFMYLLKKENRDALTKILLYHILLGDVIASGPILGTGNIVSLQGQAIEVTYNPLSANGVNVINGGSARIDNYIINPIDSVLIPDNVLPKELLPEERTTPTQSIMELTTQNPPLFSTFNSFANRAGLTQSLTDGPGPFTVFVPTNDAFAKLSSNLSTFLMSDRNKDALSLVLSYHIFGNGKISSPLTPGNVLSMQGQSVTISVLSQQNKVMINNANIIGKTEEATNGGIYIIDKVLIPDIIYTNMMQEQQQTTTIMELIQQNSDNNNNSNGMPDRGIITTLISLPAIPVSPQQQQVVTTTNVDLYEFGVIGPDSCKDGESNSNPYSNIDGITTCNEYSKCANANECCLATYCICDIPTPANSCIPPRVP